MDGSTVFDGELGRFDVSDESNEDDIADIVSSGIHLLSVVSALLIWGMLEND